MSLVAVPTARLVNIIGIIHTHTVITCVATHTRLGTHTHTHTHTSYSFIIERVEGEACTALVYIVVNSPLRQPYHQY